MVNLSAKILPTARNVNTRIESWGDNTFYLNLWQTQRSSLQSDLIWRIKSGTKLDFYMYDTFDHWQYESNACSFTYASSTCKSMAVRAVDEMPQVLFLLFH